MKIEKNETFPSQNLKQLLHHLPQLFWIHFRNQSAVLPLDSTLVP